VEIHYDVPDPVYVQVADAVDERIRSGEWAVGHRIVSEASMVQEYGIARGTARKAVAVLRDRGLVVSIPGRGHFVAPRADWGQQPAD
jgi:DNA-binding GntR family transcriptional regulator